MGTIIALIALGAVLVLRLGSAPEALGPSVGAAEREAAEPPQLAPPESRELEAARRVPTTPVEVEAPPSTPAAPREQPDAVEPTPDLEVRDPLTIKVVDEAGLPIANADVRIRGLRSSLNRGSWYSYRGDELPRGTTDGFGRAPLEHWRWVDVDGRTVSVHLVITHPAFVPFDDSSFDVGGGEHVVVLKRGATVVVSAWVGTPDVVVHDFSIEVDGEALLPRDAWRRESDGRWLTDQLASGPHMIQLEHESAAHGYCLSAIEPFDLSEGDWKELHVQLHPGQRLEGRLDASVPRPVEQGRVLLGVVLGDVVSLHREWETEIAPDGTFAFEGLPPGRGQVFALCRGYVSAKVKVRSARDAGIRFGSPPTREAEERALRRLGDRAFELPFVRVPPDTSPVVLAMEPCGALEVTVTREDGSPLTGANVEVSPNISFVHVGSWIVPWREWSALTGAGGRARFEDLPPEKELWVSADHPRFQMRKAERIDTPAVGVLPGETARATIVLEAR